LANGTKVAEACGFKPLSPDQILERSHSSQQSVLKDYKFNEKTPLWYYILAEAKDRGCLGEVGSTIVGEDHSWV
jgi:hypothetical protein